MNEYRRRSELGRFGKIVVYEELANNGWQNCTHIGGIKCFDIEAHKGGQKHLFHVETRNHTTDENDVKKNPYNLFHNKKKESDPNAEVKKALGIAISQNAIPMWATVRVDAGQQKYTICDGRVTDLPDQRSVPMGPNDILKHHKLGENVFDPRIKSEWSNVKRKR